MRDDDDEFLGRAFVITNNCKTCEGLQSLTLQKRNPRSKVSGELIVSCEWYFCNPEAPPEFYGPLNFLNNSYSDQQQPLYWNYSRQVSRELGPLPEGWEEKVLPNVKIFFVDHILKRTTWEDPRYALSNESYAVKAPEDSSQYKNKYQR